MKKVIIGFIAGIIFATAGTAMADSVTEKITAYIRPDFTLSTDGNPATIKNPPLIYNDLSYLPVREVADLLGKEVGFEDGVIKLDTEFDDPAAELARLNEAIAKSNASIEVLKSNLEGIEGDDSEQARKNRENFENAISVSEKGLIFYQNRIDSLLERYPELQE